MIKIVSAVGTMALVGADPALRQKARVKAGAVTPSIDVKGGLKGPLRDAELRPKVGYTGKCPPCRKNPDMPRFPWRRRLSIFFSQAVGSSSRLWRGLPGRPLPYPFLRPPMATFRPTDGRGEGEQRQTAWAARQARPAKGA